MRLAKDVQRVVNALTTVFQRAAEIKAEMSLMETADDPPEEFPRLQEWTALGRFVSQVFSRGQGWLICSPAIGQFEVNASA